MIDYAGKTTLITGGASGIGKALAQALKARGAAVIIADINEANLKTAAAEIGPGTHTIACDLADPAAPARLLDQAHAATGRLDLICSNAGIGHRRRLAKENFDESELKRLFEVNLFAGLRLAQLYLEKLSATNARGRILFTASENSLSVPAAIKGSGLALYAATKHALLIAAEWLRDECANAPLDVHVLMPGAVYTPLIAARLPDPSMAPPALDLIMPEQCAERALNGMDLSLFYIPTQPHLLADMQPRLEAMKASLKALQL
ncbi:MAG: SDR family oxidoreductase [Alphaproteobacteria bacterium]|nr:SDR family oxidoreductase [Alphaproteobacteria bacterium]